MQCDRCAGETFTKAGRHRPGRQLWQLDERMALIFLRELKQTLAKSVTLLNSEHRAGCEFGSAVDFAFPRSTHW